MSKRRKRVEIEERLVAEYVASVHRDARTDIRCWLGALPAEAANAEAQGINPRIYEVTGKWADAIILYPERAVIIEGKLKLNASGLGQLILYNDLFKVTEKFREYWDKPLELVYLYAFPDHQIIPLAEARGIQCIRYCPEWAREAYLTRMRRAY